MIEKGQQINERYEIIKSIGEGGMANVYLAKDIILDRKVAIKVLRGDLANDEKFVRRFRREATAASNLSHSNIVKMYDVGEDNGNYYIVMEYIEGKTLKQLLRKRGNLTVSEAIDIMLQLTDGIAHAHEMYIIHRDLKPQNIMIQEDGQIKITDFGIAMALNSTQLTQTNSVMGSVHYLPPEQASGKASTIKCDIYSMGILFYELLTGCLPFKGENAVEIALKQMKEPIPSVKKLNPSVTQSVENIIIKSTAKNPKNRYNDVKEMHDDLKRALYPDIINQAPYVFKYSEHELDDNKSSSVKPKEKKENAGNNDSSNKNRAEKVKKDEVEKTIDFVKEIPVDDNKGMKIAIGILATVFIVILFGGLFTLFSDINNTKVDLYEVPDVSGSTIDEAIDILTEAGFLVANETIKVPSDIYGEGLVVETSPKAGRKKEKHSEITIYESVGGQKIKIEDYTGKNHIEIETLLEQQGLVVDIEKSVVDDISKYDPNKIIGQSIKKDTEVPKGSRIILYIPDVYDTYPDFVKEKWTVDQVKSFCNEYKLNLTIEEDSNSSAKPGTIIGQSRTAGSRITSYAPLKITIAVEKVVPDVDEEESIE